MSIFDEKAVPLTESLRVYFVWLSNAILDVERASAEGTLKGVAQVREALDKAFSKHDTRVRELGMVLGFEHEFVRYAKSQPRFAELMTKAGDLMRKTVAREQHLALASLAAQAGGWLQR